MGCGFYCPAAKDGNMAHIQPLARNSFIVFANHFISSTVPTEMRHHSRAGGNALPYRWRPMDFEYGGKTYTNERAIATQQTGFWFVGQSRGWLPDVVGGIIWFGTDDAATSWLSPVYTSITEVPECFAEDNGSMLEYSATSAFWVCNRVANACYRMYNVMAPEVRAKADAFETAQMEAVREVDRKALDVLASGTAGAEAEVRDILTGYSVETAQKMFRDWTELEIFLLLKYIDGNVKGQNPDGSFITNGYDDGIPGVISNPGYTGKWKESVAREHGKVIEVVE